MAIDLGGRADSIWPQFSEYGASDSATLNGKGGNSMDPVTMAALIKGGSEILGGALGGGGGVPAQSGNTQYLQFTTGTNTVATSGSKATADTGLPWYVWVIMGVVAIKFFKSKG